MKVKSLSRVRVLATPWTVAHQAPPSMRFSWQEYWSGLPLPSPSEIKKAQKKKRHYLKSFSSLNIYSIYVYKKSAQTQTQVVDVAQDTVSGLRTVSMYYTLIVTYVSTYNNILIYNILFIIILHIQIPPTSKK